MSANKALAIARIRAEYEDLENDPLTEIGCDVDIEDEDDENKIFHWDGMFQGPEDTPYKGAFLYFTIDFNNDYPKSAPDVKFCFKNMYHLNVSPTSGHVCIGILNEWNPNTKIRQVLYAIFSILYNQNPESTYDNAMATLYKNNREEFNQNARNWVRANALNIRK